MTQTTSFDALLAAPRVTIEAQLEPLIGTRIQPTGFPNLGAAEFETPDGTQCLLIESAQSIANRLEAVAWDEAKETLVDALGGLPYVKTEVEGVATDSIREAHRLNSAYLNGIWPRLRERAGIPTLTKGKAKPKPDPDAAGEEEENASASVDRRKLAAAIFFYDPSSVLHGVFLEKITGLARLTRIVSGFIEARDVRLVASGGVKNDRVDPSGKAYSAIIDGESKSGAKAGFGNVPYARTEYTARSITASFSIDTTLIRSYGLGSDAERLLFTLALWKITTFLAHGARLRSACDLIVKVDGLTITRPERAPMPSIGEIEALVKASIVACRETGLFADPAVTAVVFQK